MKNTITNKMALECAMIAVENMTMNFRMAGSDVEFTPEEVKEKLSAMFEQMNKKVVSKKDEEKSAQNESFKVEIMSALADGKHKTATEILEILPAMKNNQKVSSILRLMRLSGLVDRETVKGKTYYFAV